MTKLTSKICAVMLFSFGLVEPSFGQAITDCTVNAGGNATICGSSTMLTGSASGNVSTSPPSWTFISGPGSITPTINHPDSLITTVSGMTVDGDYVFSLSQPCGSGTATSQVTITAHPRPASFTAGADITNICATTGTTVLAGDIPLGFTGEWRSMNVYSYERFGSAVSTNSEFSSTTTDTPTFSLINKANHEIDPAYWNILKITSNDGVCSYEDTMTVSFVPNPHIVLDTLTELCAPSTTTDRYIYLASAPSFSTSFPGTAGVLSGTTVTMSVNSQPTGANISFDEIRGHIMYFNGVTASGTYKFTVTVANSCGTYTTPEITYKLNGVTPHLVDFQPTGHGAPEQLAIYQTSGSGGEVHCGLAGDTTAQTFYFNINPLDSPSEITTIYPSGIIPSGVAPTVSFTGAGTYNRVATVTPPTGGWATGTYKFSVNTANAVGGCNTTQNYYIHIPDGNRPDVHVPDASTCYEGNGSVSATITLPNAYIETVNSSYLQDFSGQYNISLVSKPAGAANPTYEADNLRSLTSPTTVISNLDTIGDYYFRIAPAAYTTSVGPFLNQEYACANASMVDTFMVRVEGKINANAGSDQSLVCGTNIATLVGNSTSAGSGLWTVAEAPAGTSASFTNDTARFTDVNGFAKSGTYIFAWNITSPYGGCVSSDSTTVNVANCLPVANDDYVAASNNAANGDVSTNDSMGNGAGTFVILTNPANGTATLNSDGTFTYTAPSSYSGTDQFTYRLCDEDGDCDTATVYISNILPIHLLSFDAKREGATAHLEWVTSSEQNNTGFDVERSLNGKQWQALGFVVSKAQEGNSRLELTYAYTDRSPVNGQNFYRLKQMDINGDYQYSQVRMVNFKDGSSVQVHPNPVQENVMVSGLTGKNKIVVTNVLGQVVLRVYTNGEENKELHTAVLTPGVYLIRVTDEHSNNLVFKMIKE